MKPVINETKKTVNKKKNRNWQNLKKITDIKNG